MVKLNKIYTRTGDAGMTGLVGGARVAKHSKRVGAYGEIDELNAVLGNARMHSAAAINDPAIDESKICEQIARIQNDLFDLGADLATMAKDKPALRITQQQVARLEREIDDLNAMLKPLDSFILPGGTPLASWLHLARTVARRAERHMTELASLEHVNAHALAYMNRLSDLLFVMARYANDKGQADILWVPAYNQTHNE